MDDKRRIYELFLLVEAQKTKIEKLGRRVRVAHKQAAKKIPTKTLLHIIFTRLWQKLSSLHR